ncbi:MAG: hypothetical protein AAGD32_11740 [Planctomycetota bacterium]
MVWLLLGPLAFGTAVIFWLRYRQPADADEPWRESLEEDDDAYDPEYDDVEGDDEIDDDYDTDVRPWS